MSLGFYYLIICAEALEVATAELGAAPKLLKRRRAKLLGELGLELGENLEACEQDLKAVMGQLDEPGASIVRILSLIHI